MMKPRKLLTCNSAVNDLPIDTSSLLGRKTGVQSKQPSRPMLKPNTCSSPSIAHLSYNTHHNWTGWKIILLLFRKPLRCLGHEVPGSMCCTEAVWTNIIQGRNYLCHPEMLMRCTCLVLVEDKQPERRLLVTVSLAWIVLV